MLSTWTERNRSMIFNRGIDTIDIQQTQGFMSVLSLINKGLYIDRHTDTHIYIYIFYLFPRSLSFFRLCVRVYIFFVNLRLFPSKPYAY